MALLLTPITLILAVLLPFTDLPALPYLLIAPIVAAKRNSFRALLLSILVVISLLYIGTDLASLVTEVGKNSGLVDNATKSASFMSSGQEVIAWFIVKITSLFS